MSSPVTAHCLHCKATLPLDDPRINLKQLVVNRLHAVGKCSVCKRNWSSYKPMPDPEKIKLVFDDYKNGEVALLCYDTHQASVKASAEAVAKNQIAPVCMCTGCVLRHNEKQALEESARKSLQGVTTQA